MAGGQGDAGIPHLQHQIHLVEIGAEGLLRFGDVARIPLDQRLLGPRLGRGEPGGWGRAHQGTTITGQGAS